MRLTDNEIKMIKKAFLESFEDVKIYLFESRVDDTKRGGDIDLYIVPNQKLSSSQLLKKKIDFLVHIKSLIGDQKIDIVVSRDTNRLIEREALQKGVEL